MTKSDDPRVVTMAVAVALTGLAAIRYWVLFFKWRWYPFHKDAINNVIVAFPIYTLPFDMYLYFAKDDETDNHRRAMFGKLAFALSVATLVFLAILLMIRF